MALAVMPLEGVFAVFQNGIFWAKWNRKRGKRVFWKIGVMGILALTSMPQKTALAVMPSISQGTPKPLF